MSKDNPSSGPNKSPDINWAATDDAEDFGTILSGKLRDYSRTGSNTGLTNLHYSNVSVAYTHVYGMDVEGVGANAALVTRSGEQGSIAELRIPAAASLLTKQWNLVVGPELSWSCHASNTDYASEAKTVTARQAIQYYWEDRNVAATAKAAAFEALAFGECALHVPWDEQLGEVEAVDSQVSESGQPVDKLIRSGDIAYRLVSTWDIIRDPTARSWDSLSWICVREWVNKWDAAASTDDKEAAAACLVAGSDTMTYWRPLGYRSVVDSDLIPVYYFYHKQTPSVPWGRQTRFLEDGTVLSDGNLGKAYEQRLPVVRMAAGEYSGTPWPYSKFFGTLGSAQAVDSLYRDLLTNATAVSGGLIWAELESDLSVPQLGGGPKVIYGQKGTKPPVPLELQTSHAEHYSLIGKLRGENQQIMGLDDLTAGSATAMPDSGALAALMTSISVQNNSQLQASWGGFVQGIGELTLAHIQYSMKGSRRVALAGKSRSSLVTTTELSGNAVQGIDRVLVEIQSARAQTAAGRWEMATEAVKAGWVQTPKQLQSVADAGNYDALNQDLSAELLLIQEENEALGEGRQIPVMLDDDHIAHLKGHRPVIASLTARENPAVVTALQAHQDAHLEILRKTDPQVLQLFGQPAIPPTVPGQPAPGQTPAPAGAPPPHQGGAGPTTPPLQPPNAQALEHAQAPSMPVNPSTGARAEPAAGTVPPSLAIKPK